MKLSSDSTPEWLHVYDTHREVWIHSSEIVGIETPGKEGKPRGWVEDCAAAVRCKGDMYYTLNKSEWQVLQVLLGIK